MNVNIHKYRIRSSISKILFLVALTFLFAACSKGHDLYAPDPIDDPARLVWSLRLNHRIVSMSLSEPSNSLQLEYVVRNALGERIENASPPLYQSNDPSRVRVTSDGLVTAHATTSSTTPVIITARTSLNSISVVDTLHVRVYSTPQPVTFSGISIQPDSPGDTILGFESGLIAFLANKSKTFPLRVATAPVLTGTNYTVGLYSSDRNVVYPSFELVTVTASTGIAQVMLTAVKPGTATIYATATIFGVQKTDSFRVTVTAPNASLVTFNTVTENDGGRRFYFTPSLTTIRKGGIVVWSSSAPTADTLSLIFDEPEAVHPACILTGCSSAGNIDHLIGYVGKSFPVPGTYVYRSHRQGVVGQVVVLDE